METFHTGTQGVMLVTVSGPAYPARTARLRTDRAAALGALTAVAARIAALRASRPPSGAIRRVDGDGAPTDAGRSI